MVRLVVITAALVGCGLGRKTVKEVIVIKGDSATDQKIRTMEELATVSGVSRPTISKYFKDPASVRKTTRQRIENAVREHDYRPNIFAINLNRKATKNVGIVVPYLADPFFAEIVRRLESHCIEAGYRPVLYSANGEPEQENSALDSLRSLKPTGALIAPLGEASDLEILRKFTADVPTVLFDSMLAIGEAFVGSDNDHSIGLIVDYLCRTGEPPCFFEMPPVNPNATDRSKAYIQAMERLGFEPKIVRTQTGGWNFEQIGFEEGKELIGNHRLPSNTVLCSNDRIAIGLLAAAYEKGLRVGAGPGCAMRIAGHDDHPWARFTCPPLTTVAQDLDAIAQRSVQTLFKIVEADGAVRSAEQMRLQGRLIMRSSA